MGRRARERDRARAATARRKWVFFGLSAGLIFGAAGWWIFARDATGADGRDIASYRPPDIHALAVHPADPGTVIFGSHRGMLISRDSGRTWKPIGPNGDA